MSSKLLEELQTGTPVRSQSGAEIGRIEAVYALGESRVAAFLLVYWNKRSEAALVASDEVMSVEDDGVVLALSEESYSQLPAFDPSANPTLYRLGNPPGQRRIPPD
jgi:uncharacterized protein YrrD